MNLKTLSTFTCVLVSVQAQDLQTSSDADARSMTDSPNYTVLARDGNSKVWARVTWRTNLITSELTAKTNSYVELTPGSAHLVNGQWVDSSDQIQITQIGAQATNAQHHVALLGNINLAKAVDLILPEGGKHLAGTIVGLAYEDKSSGKSVLIAELKDSIGQLLPSGNRVLYPDAFTDLEANAVKADVLYVNKIASFEQLVIIRQQLPAPSEWGLDNESSVFQVITSFEDPPQPAITNRKIGGEIDQHLDFGIIQMGQGVAFALGNETNTIPVTKQWLLLDGRQCLVEQTRFTLLQPLLKNLPGPPGHAGLLKSPDGVIHRVVSRLTLPRRQLAANAPPSMILARVEPPDQGVAIDWSAVVTQTNMTFQGDTTYYVSSNPTLSGTTTIEGGTVIKFTNSATAQITLAGSLVCNTAPYKMAILTSKDDNTCGESISGSTGSPTNYNGATFISGDTGTYKYLRCCYAGTGIYSSAALGSLPFWHCQFVNCGTAISIYDNNVELHNVLFANCGTAVYIFKSGDTLSAEHVTADQITTFLGKPGNTGTLTNCILTAVTGSLTNVTLYNCTSNSSGTGIFQSVGGANYYLIAGSTNRNIGSSSINSNTLADIQKKTTCPPIVYSNVTISVDTNLSIQTIRDTDTPDLGYHYDTLDYAFGGTTANGNVTFSNGVAVGWFRTSSGWQHAGHGLQMADAKVVTFDGTGESPNYWVRCNVVQEGCNSVWQGGYGPGGITGWAWPDIANSPQIVARFTRFSMLAGDGNHYRDDWGWIIANGTSCEYYGGGAGYYNGGHHYTNCLFLRTPISLYTDHAPSSFSMRNCTVIGAQVSPTRLNDGTNAPVVIRESAFDGTTVSTSGAGLNVTYYDYNAFLQSGSRTTPTGTHDQLATNFNWQTSWLGNYYLPTNSSLVNTGGVSADVIGLFHYTTQTNQIKDGSSTVDLGYHYLAVDSTGKPIDSNSDGILDYLADNNGNGVMDFGEPPFAITIDNPANGSIINK